MSDNALDLDAIRQGVAHIHRTQVCPVVERLADVDIPALLAEVERLQKQLTEAQTTIRAFVKPGGAS